MSRNKQPVYVWIGQPIVWELRPRYRVELIRFQPLPFGKIVWHLITKMNDGDLSAWITVFDPRMGNIRRFIIFLVYNLFYTSIATNLVTLDTLSPWYDSVRTHTCYTFSMKLLLRRHRTVKTGLLINY